LILEGIAFQTLLELTGRPTRRGAGDGRGAPD